MRIFVSSSDTVRIYWQVWVKSDTLNEAAGLVIHWSATGGICCCESTLVVVSFGIGIIYPVVSIVEVDDSDLLWGAWESCFNVTDSGNIDGPTLLVLPRFSSRNADGDWNGTLVFGNKSFWNFLARSPVVWAVESLFGFGLIDSGRKDVIEGCFASKVSDSTRD